MKSLLATGLLVVGLVLLLGGAEGLKTVGALKKVVFAHRHCARTPIHNTDHSCDGLGCGMCTPEGLDMLKATGESFRQRYGSILPNEYLMDRFKSLSDSDDRTIQSSAAFIKGLFAYNASYTAYPATNTGGKALLDPWWLSLPTYHLHKGVNFGGADKVLATNVTQHISLETIMAVGAELGLENCSVSGAAAFLCAKREADFVLSMRSSGTLGNYPVAQKHLAEFLTFTNWWVPLWDVLWQLHVSKDDFFQKAGWPAHALLDNMLAAAGSDDGTVVHEYSGHDLTLMPLYAVMGNYTFVYPLFASSVVFEVYENPNPFAKANPFVVVKTALPDQLPGSHRLTWFDYELTCQNASGQTYTTTAGCPLSDMQAFAATRSGTETGKLGGCYAFPSDLVKTNCTNKDGVVPTNPLCLAYRKSCPLVACGPGYYMKPDNSCNKL